MMSEKKEKVTLEQILRLKRAEKPSVEFWARFESELRAKQLAAIVDRRPWWTGLSRAFGAVSRHHLPIGALAALALTWIGVRQFEPSMAVHVGVPAPEDRIASAVVPASPAAVPAQAARFVEEDSEASSEAPEAAQTPKPIVRADSPHIVSVAAVQAAPSPERSPFAINVQYSADRETSSPHMLGIDMASMQTAGWDASRRFAAASEGFAATEVSARRPATDPLAHLDPASDERRSRLLATALPVVAASAAPMTVSNERVITRLSEDRFYESVSRYSGGGDRFSIKF